MKKLLILLTLAALCEASQGQATNTIPTSSGTSLVDPNAAVIRQSLSSRLSNPITLAMAASV